MAEEMQSTGGDGFGAYQSSSRTGDAPVDDDASLRAAISQVALQNGMATVLRQKVFDSCLQQIYSKFGARTSADKHSVDITLCWYFSVHGTSPDTPWATYDYPIVALGKELRPMEIVGIMGEDKIKKFMGRFSTLTIRLYSISHEFQSAMAERTARRNLPPGEGVHSIDYLGKDGSLSHSEAAVRVVSREQGLAYRARNLNSLSTVRRGQLVNDVSNDARAAGNVQRPIMDFN